MDSNARINLAVVIGVVGAAWLLTVGAVVLAGIGKTSPEWMGSVILSVTSGLVGYLARDVKQQHQTPATEPTVEINQTVRGEADEPLTKESLKS